MARVATVEACRFILDCLQTAGANRESAKQQADLLVNSAVIGQPGLGINKIEYFVNDIVCGICKPENKPTILSETASTAWVDAHNAMGATASHFAMDIAIDKAKKTGVGWVVVKSSNHNGNAGYWAKKAADRGLIGMAFTNTSPVLAPTRSKQAALGSNPIAMAAPACDGESFYFDMATSAVTLEKIQCACRKGERIPAGWAQGPNGHSTCNAEEAYTTRRLYPLGGVEESSGYKGYGLAAMVEILTGISSGSCYGTQVRRWTLSCDSRPADISHCFIAVDPNCFAPGFGDRLANSIQQWRDLEPVDPDKPVIAPGDMEKISECVATKTNSIYFSDCLLESCEYLAKKLNIKPLSVTPPRALIPEATCPTIESSCPTTCPGKCGKGGKPCDKILTPEKKKSDCKLKK